MDYQVAVFSVFIVTKMEHFGGVSSNSERVTCQALGELAWNDPHDNSEEIRGQQAITCQEWGSWLFTRAINCWSITTCCVTQRRRSLFESGGGGGADQNCWRIVCERQAAKLVRVGSRGDALARVQGAVPPKAPGFQCYQGAERSFFWTCFQLKLVLEKLKFTL